jgi:hypothetical protein
MKRLAVALGVAAAAVAGVAWWPRQPPAVATAPEQPRVLARAEAAPAAAPAPADSPASRKLDELRTMSESVRNSTFVIAIRAAGFMCEDVVDVYAGADAPAWRARCRDSRAYYVHVADAGDLAVEPTLDYFDGVGAPPRAIDSERGRPDPTGLPPEPLEPRR